MTLPDNDTLSHLLADAAQRDDSMLAFKATDMLDLMSQALAAEVIALRKRVQAADAMAELIVPYVDCVLARVGGKSYALSASAAAYRDSHVYRDSNALSEALAAYRATVTP